jgi:hypothetical protein
LHGSWVLVHGGDGMVSGAGKAVEGGGRSKGSVTASATLLPGKRHRFRYLFGAVFGVAQRGDGGIRTVFGKSNSFGRCFSTSRSSGRDIRYRWTGRKADRGRLDFLMSRNRHGSVCRAELRVKRELVTVVPDLSCCCETSTREWIARGLQDLGQSGPAATQPPLSSGRGTTSRASEGHCEWRLISNWKQN